MVKVQATVTAPSLEKEKFVQIGTVAEFIKNIAKTDDINSFTEILDKTLHFAKNNPDSDFCFKALYFIDGPEKQIPMNKVRSIGNKPVWSMSDNSEGITKVSNLEVFQYQGKSWVKVSDYESTIFE